MERAARLWVARANVYVRRRSLIGEILIRQLTVAAVIGALAFGGLWWASTLIVRDHMRAWGEQWLDNLDELAAPLYSSDDVEKFVRTEADVDGFAEILFVRYYAESGAPMLTELADGGREIAPLEPQRLEGLASRAAHSSPHLIDTVFLDIPVVRIAKPIWAQSVPGDGLLGFDPSSTAVDEKLLGYVELGLDFSRYLAYEVRAILTAVAIGAGLLLLLTTASWLIYRRALLPLSALQAPLRQLAHGQTDFSVTPSGHREIAAIANALRATASALDERNQRLTHLANRDELTGLLNRSAFHELLGREMQSAAESGRASALLFVDLDRFKYVNDSLSHGVGDRLLKLAAHRLQASVRPNDVVARFGGDEFVVLLRDVSRKEAAAICGDLVKQMQGETFSEGGRSLNIRCSVGATMIRGSKVTPDKLLSRADTACHQAKSNGRNQFCFYKVSSKEMVEMAADGDWCQQIQTALKQDAFVLHYQPIVNIRTRETVCHEALLRMHVDDDIAFPGAFLPAAARLGLTVDIDHWVIRQSLRSLAALRSVQGNTCFTLNVSGSTFDREDFCRMLERELRDTGVPPDAIIIEITEQTAMRNPAEAATQMANLVERGCRFAIDDFGSGYCSYSYLKNLPVAFVKIDGSFIANLAEDAVDQRIVAAIAEVAAATECETIAEHVKDYETLRLLDGLGVTYAQGYFLGRPSAEVKPAVLPIPLAVPGRRAPRRIALRPRTT